MSYDRRYKSMDTAGILANKKNRKSIVFLYKIFVEKGQVG